MTSCGEKSADLAPKASSEKVDAAVSAWLPKSPTGYYGVYTTSNVVLFGKLARTEEEWMVLSDVHYIRSNVDPEKRRMSNQLIRRAQEWHAPEESAIARRNILVIEPVAANSRMMDLIRKMKQAPPAPQP